MSEISTAGNSKPKVDSFLKPPAIKPSDLEIKSLFAPKNEEKSLFDENKLEV